MNVENDVRRAGNALVDSVRENPLGAALLGMGLVWLISSRTGASEIAGRALQSTGEAIGSAASSVGDAARRAGATVSDLGASAGAVIRDKADAAYDSLRDVSDDVRHAARDASDRAAGIVHDMSGKALEIERTVAQEWSGMSGRRTPSAQIGAAREWMSQHLTNQPLLLAAGALAVGAAIAATLPATQVEAKAFGKAARDPVEGAADAAKGGLAKAVDRADDVVRAATDEAKRHGLTPDALATKANELGAKARDAVADAGATLKDASRKMTDSTLL